MTRLVVYITTECGSIGGKRMPPHPFARTGGYDEGKGFAMTSVPTIGGDSR